jgi:nitrile hydratase
VSVVNLVNMVKAIEMVKPASVGPSLSANAGGQMSNSKNRVEASLDARAAALEKVVVRQQLLPDEYIDEFHRKTHEDWVHTNGARLVARAWVDPAFRQRFLSDGRAAAAEFGFGMPEHHRSLVALENTDRVHNVICCTLCSCNAFTIIGMPPNWYKDLNYRARVVREARTVLSEMGVSLSDDMEVRVWDTTADTRYIVLPVQPAYSMGWDEDRLASIVTQDSMIGVARL